MRIDIIYIHLYVVYFYIYTHICLKISYEPVNIFYGHWHDTDLFACDLGKGSTG